MKNLVRIVSFLLFACTIPTLVAQTETFKHIQAEDLPFKRVYSLEKSKTGFLFLATEKGVYRFDGLHFKLLQLDVEDEFLLLQKNSDSSLYAVSITNKIFELANDSLKPAADLSQNTSDYVRYVKHENSIYYSSSGQQVYFLNPLNHRKDSIPLPYSFKTKNSFKSIPLAVKKNLIYYHVSTNKASSIIALNLKSNKWSTILESAPIYVKTNLFEFNNGFQLLNNKPGELKDELLNLEESKLINKNFNPERSANRYRIYTNNNQLFILTDDGLEIYNNHLELKKTMLQKHTITGINLNGNTLWLSTLKSGLFYFPNINAITIQDSIQSEMNQVFAFKNHLLATSENGSVYEIEKENLRPLIAAEKNNTVNFKFKPTQFSNELLYLLVPNIYTFKSENGKINFSKKRSTLSNKDHSIYKSLEVGSFHQGTRVSVPLNNKKVLSDFLPGDYLKNAKNSYEENGKLIYNLSKERGYRNLIHLLDSSIWLAAKSGLIKFSKNGIDSIKLDGKNIIAYQLSSNNGKIWFSNNSSLYSFSKTINEEFKAPSNLEIKNFNFNSNSISISTSNGIYLLDCNSKNVTSIGFQKGLPHQQINSSLLLDSVIYASSKKGITVLPLNKEQKSNHNLSVWFGSIAVNNTEFKDSTVALSQLTHHQNNLEITLGGKDLRSFEERTYWYQLKGVDNDWVSTKTEATIRYPDIKSGKYTFHCYLQNELGEKSQPISIAIKIDLPYYQKWWFILISIAFIGLLIYLLFRFRLKQIEEKKELANQLIQSEIDGMKSQMNPHFIFNALNSIQDLIITKDIANSNLYLGKFAKLLRTVLNYSSKKTIKIGEEIELLKTYLELEQLRFQNELSFEVKSENSEIDYFEIPPLLLQPYVENALKHGLLHSSNAAKELKITFFEADKFIVCKIQDNGIGRAASEKIKERRAKYHESYATEAIEKRINLINATLNQPILIKIMDLEEGTCVEVRFPV